MKADEEVRPGASRDALHSLPCSEMYEKSYLHRDHVTHIIVTSSDFVITGSKDGHVKFWKKSAQAGIEFVKTFRAHLAPIICMSASVDGSLLATTASDAAFKVFDVLAFDMISWVKLDHSPGVCEWIDGDSGRAAARPLLAVADAEAPQLRLFDASGTLVRSVDVHSARVVLMKLNAAKDAMVSADERGVIEYWTTAAPHAPPKNVTFRYKTETDLYVLAKAKVALTSLAVSPNGEHFAITAADFKVRLFQYASGKCLRVLDESYEAMHHVQKEGGEAYRLEAFDFGRRMAVEREYRAAVAGGAAPASNALFDASSRFLLYPSPVGIKMISLASSKLARLLGKVENTERFVALALFQGTPKVSASTIGSGAKASDVQEDPTLFCAAFKKSRFYLFSRREPEEPEAAGAAAGEAQGRDVFNEKPSMEEIALLQREAVGPLPRVAIITTTYGEVQLRLFPDECPKTVENFATHAVRHARGADRGAGPGRGASRATERGAAGRSG